MKRWLDEGLIRILGIETTGGRKKTGIRKQGKLPKRPPKKEETKRSLMEQVLRNMPQMPGMPPAPAPKPKRDLWATLGRINDKKEQTEGEPR